VRHGARRRAGPIGRAAARLRPGDEFRQRPGGVAGGDGEAEREAADRRDGTKSASPS
jgi:hypothetical protein